MEQNVHDIFKSMGDVAAYHFTLSDFITDGNWHDLDLSSIINGEATAIRFRLVIQATLFNKLARFRKKGFINEINIATAVTQFANVPYYTSMVIGCDKNDIIIQYKIDNANWSIINLAIQGYYL